MLCLGNSTMTLGSSRSHACALSFAGSVSFLTREQAGSCGCPAEHAWLLAGPVRPCGSACGCCCRDELGGQLNDAGGGGGPLCRCAWGVRAAWHRIIALGQQPAPPCPCRSAGLLWRLTLSKTAHVQAASTFGALLKHQARVRNQVAWRGLSTIGGCRGRGCHRRSCSPGVQVEQARQLWRCCSNLLAACGATAGRS